LRLASCLFQTLTVETQINQKETQTVVSKSSANQPAQMTPAGPHTTQKPQTSAIRPVSGPDPFTIPYVYRADHPPNPADHNRITRPTVLSNTAARKHCIATDLWELATASMSFIARLNHSPHNTGLHPGKLLYQLFNEACSCGFIGS
jgi:hypothetical protein